MYLFLQTQKQMTLNQALWFEHMIKLQLISYLVLSSHMYLTSISLVKDFYHAHHLIKQLTSHSYLLLWLLEFIMSHFNLMKILSYVLQLQSWYLTSYSKEIMGNCWWLGQVLESLKLWVNTLLTIFHLEALWFSVSHHTLNPHELYTTLEHGAFSNQALCGWEVDTQMEETYTQVLMISCASTHSQFLFVCNPIPQL